MVGKRDDYSRGDSARVHTSGPEQTKVGGNQNAQPTVYLKNFLILIVHLKLGPHSVLSKFVRVDFLLFAKSD